MDLRSLLAGSEPETMMRGTWQPYLIWLAVLIVVFWLVVKWTQ